LKERRQKRSHGLTGRGCPCLRCSVDIGAALLRVRGPAGLLEFLQCSEYGRIGRFLLARHGIDDIVDGGLAALPEDVEDLALEGAELVEFHGDLTPEWLLLFTIVLQGGVFVKRGTRDSWTQP